MIPSYCIPVQEGDRATLIIRESVGDFFVIHRTKHTSDGRWYQYRIYNDRVDQFFLPVNDPGIYWRKEYTKHRNRIT